MRTESSRAEPCSPRGDGRAAVRVHAPRSARATPEAACEPRPHGAADLRREPPRPSRRRPAAGRRPRRGRWPTCCPACALRATPPRLPELAEPQVVRHYTRLSQLNHSRRPGLLSAGLVHHEVQPQDQRRAGRAARLRRPPPLPGRGGGAGHPRASCASWSRRCSRSPGMQPGHAAAGGRRPRRAGRHPHDPGLPPRPRRRPARDTVIVPDSAHGTNLASASHGRLPGGGDPQLRPGPGRSRRPAGSALRAHRRPHAHQPQHPGPLRGGHPRDRRARSTRPGALCLLRRRQPQRHHGQGPPGRHGHGRGAPEPAQDLLHPARRRRPGSRAGGRGRAARALPAAARWSAPLGRHGGRYRLDYDRPRSIGRVKGFYGNVGVLVRAYAYILRMGGDGLTRASEDAVLNANYLRARLQRPATRCPTTASACTSSCSPPPRHEARGGRPCDIAKRILDFGMHAPTVYFPLIVPEALMIEPTETENRRTLDAFVARSWSASTGRSTRIPPSCWRLPTPPRSAGRTRQRRPATRSCAGGPTSRLGMEPALRTQP